MPLKSWSRSILPTLVLLIVPALSMAQVGVNISVNFPPPELPIYDQPPIPGDGYLWTPGYWAWSGDDEDYYWIPGTWVLAPQRGYLWTPGYWDEEDEVFFWHPGYWGRHVGFYGGVVYGYGYGGEGFEGGYWQGGRLYYNRSVNNIDNTSISNVYNRTVSSNDTVNRVSYNGRGGIRARPTAPDEAAARDSHIAFTPMQREHEQAARSNTVQRAGENGGHPPIAATPRPGAFSAAGVVAARPGGTMSVVHQPGSREAQPESRGSQPQYRVPQPESRVAQPEYRAPPPEYRAAPPEPRPAAPPTMPRQQQPMVEPRQPMIEQRRQPEQTQQPRQDAPQPRSEARPDPRTGQRPQERQ